MSAAAALVAEQRRRRRAASARSTTPRARTRSQARSAATAGARQRHPPLLGALAPDHDRGPVEVERADVQAAQLADPQARAVEHLEHGVVALAPPVRLVLGRRAVEQLVEVAPVEHPRQAPVAARACTPTVGSASTVPGAHAATGSSAAAPPPCGRCCAGRTAGSSGTRGSGAGWCAAPPPARSTPARPPTWRTHARRRRTPPRCAATTRTATWRTHRPARRPARRPPSADARPLSSTELGARGTRPRVFARSSARDR